MEQSSLRRLARLEVISDELRHKNRQLDHQLVTVTV